MRSLFLLIAFVMTNLLTTYTYAVWGYTNPPVLTPEYSEFPVTNQPFKKGKSFQRNLFVVNSKGVDIDVLTQQCAQFLFASWNDEDGCRKTIMQELSSIYEIIKKQDIKKFREFPDFQYIDFGRIAMWHAPWKDMEMLSVRKYQDGFLFLSAPGRIGPVDINDHVFGFVRVNDRDGFIQIFMTQVAPEFSTQYNKYTQLYSYPEYWDYDLDSFQSDLIKSFKRNRFNNKGTQEVYSSFLRKVDESTQRKAR